MIVSTRILRFVCALGASGAAMVAFGGCSQGDDGRSAVQLPPQGTARQAIQGGTETGGDYSFAVGVCGGFRGQCAGVCSGALILPNVVATARHCVDETNETVDCRTNPTFGARHSQMFITTNQQMFQSNQGWHRVKQIVTTNDDHICGNDIALLILEDVISSSEAKPVIPGVQYAMSDLEHYSRKFTAIGFGNTSPAGQGSGTRRIRSGIDVLCIPGDDVFEPCPSLIHENEFVGGDGTCRGDSGSSAFESSTLKKNAPVSFGVLSRGGQSDDGTKCEQSLYTRFDKFRDLVLQAAVTASSNWTLYPKPVPDWTLYVPPKPKDAGAPEAGKKPKPKLPAGEACASNEECESALCTDTGEGSVCADACEDGAEPSTCGEGYVCQDSVCVIDPGTPAPVAAAPTTTTTTTTGCSTSARAKAAPSWAGLGLGALGAALMMARRRRPRR